MIQPMPRHLFLSIALLCTAANFPAEALPAQRCEERAANCIGTCNNPGGGTNENRCMSRCDRRVMSCLVHADEAWSRLEVTITHSR
jgi:hypothetical protein